MPARHSEPASDICPRRFRRSAVLLSLTLLCALIGGCSLARENYLRRELVNLGPLALSPDNPYIDPNRLLILERNESFVLNGFLSHRGEPNALELIQNATDPLELRLYYYDKGEMYRLRESPDEWLVGGPLPLPEDRLRILKPSAAPRAKPPQHPTASARRINAVRSIEIAQERTAEREKAKAEESGTTAKSSPAETPLPEVRTHLEAKPKILPSEQKDKEAAPAINIPTDAKARASGGELPTLRSGARESDLLHTVTYSGETLRMIAAWYTGTPENAERIARLNKLPDADKLELHQTIRIPEYLVVRMEPFGREEVRQYLRTRSLPIE